MTPKRTIALLLVLMSLFGLSAIAEEKSPTATLVEFIELLRKRDIDAAAQIALDKDALNFLKENAQDPKNRLIFGFLIDTVEVSFGREVIEGDTAAVEVSLHSFRGEAINNLQIFLDYVLKTLPEDATEEEKVQAMVEAALPLDFKGLAPHTYSFRYHLVKQDGAWKLDTSKQEEIDR